VADTVTLTFRVKEDGSLQQIGTQAEKTAKSTDKATKASHNYNKGQKGVAATSSNSTKNFSKMRNAIGGGSGGLVGAYAALAANMFALTAAFGALSSASRATQLEEGLVALGKASGVAMHTLSRGLVEATGHAISMEESMRSVALITSAGIDPSAIERFGKVARGAALALGRDTNDAISRLTRGITKLEPELLDELGIMVRLDEASKTYADSVGKSVSDLTRYEKSQAFLNATLEEGERKFGAMANVDVNVYDKLAASLKDLAKSGIGGLAAMIEPVVSYLASSPYALVGVLLLFASTISSAVVGSLSEMATKLAKTTAETLKSQKAQMTHAQGLNTSSATLKRFVKTLEEGGDVLGEYDKAMAGQEQSLQTAAQWRDAGTDSQERYNEKTQKAKDIMNDLTSATRRNALAQVENASASAMVHFANGNLLEGWKDTGKALKGVGEAMKAGWRTSKGLTKGFTALKMGSLALGPALKSVGAGVMAMLGPVGMALSLFMMLKDVFMAVWEFFKSDEIKSYEKSVTELSEAQEELNTNMKEASERLNGVQNSVGNLTGAYTAMSNTLDTFLAKYNAVAKAGAAVGKYKEQAKAQKDLIANSDYLTRKLEEFKKKHPDGFGTEDSTKAQVKATEKFLNQMHGVAGNIKGIGLAAKATKEGMTTFLNAKKIKTDVDEIVTGLQDLTNNLVTFEDNGVDFTINTAALEDGKFGELINDMLTGDMAVVNGLMLQKKALNEENKITADLTEKITAANLRLADAKEAQKFSKETHFGHKARQATLDAAQAEVDGIQEVIDASREKSEAIGIEVANKLVGERKVREEQQKQIILNATIISQKQGEVKLQKELSSNTKTSLDKRLAATNDLVTAERARDEFALSIVERNRRNLETQQKLGDNSTDTANQITSLLAEEKDLKTKILISTAKILGIEEKALETAKMRVAEEQDMQKGKKALLDITAKILKKEQSNFNIRMRLVQLAKRNENRAAGIDNTESQRLTIELDSKVHDQKKAFILREALLKVAGFKLDRKMTELKLKMLKEEIIVLNKKRGENEAAISLTEVNEAISLLSDNGELFNETMEGILLNAELLTSELDEQKTSTNLITMARAEQLTHEIAIKEKIREASDLMMQAATTSQSVKGTLNEIAQLENTNIFGEPRDIKEAAKLAKEAGYLKIDAAVLAYQHAVLTHKLEMASVQARYALLKAEMSSDNYISENEAEVLNATLAVIEAQKAAGEAQLKSAKVGIKLVEAQAEAANRKALGAAAGKGWLEFILTDSGQKDAKDDGDKTKTGEVSVGGTVKSGRVDGTGQDSMQAMASTRNKLLEQIRDAITGEGGVKSKAKEEDDSAAVAKMKKDGLYPEKEPDTNSLKKEEDAARDAGWKAEAGAAAKEHAATAMQGMKESMKAAMIEELKKNAEEQADDSVKESMNTVHEPVEKKPIFKRSEGGLLSELPNLEEVQGHLKGVAKDMAALGPEGEGPSQIFAGMASMASAFESGITSAEGISSAISGVAGMMAGASKMKVAAIDKEIAAEQKRDGKSKGSIAKIKALEKKKEQVERKAFNTKKKLNMAQVITSTATAIMKESEKGFPAAIPGIAMFGAMGAAQLAVISGMTYQGGGSAPTASAPASLALGERNNTVDLAKGNNASGELAYMRGEDGQGRGASDFKAKGAFSGYKHRNTGGYVVGEQGPELFMPETPGEIIPAGRLGGGEPTNVNFNISAVDAAGVEDVLIRQKGHIIRMIREAANEHGQPFLEDISDGAYVD
jgi:hypothetical protein